MFSLFSFNMKNKEHDRVQYEKEEEIRIKNYLKDKNILHS